MLGNWVLITIGAVVLSAAVSVLIGQARETPKAEQLVAKLIERATRPRIGTVDFGALSNLPPPIARYFRHVLTDGQELIHVARLQQSGMRQKLSATERYAFRQNTYARYLLHQHLSALGITQENVALTQTTANGKDAQKLRDLGADEIIDYTTANFAMQLSGYDVVIDSLGGDNLSRSLTVLKPGGLAISVVGPPDTAFASQLGQPLLKPVMWILSRNVRAQAKKLGVRYSFFCMRANGEQLKALSSLYDAGVLRPVVDRAFEFNDTLEAIAYVEKGRAKGKVVTVMPSIGTL